MVRNEKIVKALMVFVVLSIFLLFLNVLRSNQNTVLYIFVCAAVYILTCVAVDIKIKLVEESSHKHEIYFAIYAISDVIVSILSICFVGPLFGYALAILIPIVWFLGKLINYTKDSK